MGGPFTHAFATFLHGKEVTLWMMSCGVLVSSQEIYTQLAADVQWQGDDFLVLAVLKALFLIRTPCLRFNCITTAQLQPCLTVSFILSYAHSKFWWRSSMCSVSCETFCPPVQASVPHQYSPYLPSPEGEHRGTRYVWVHAKIRPWATNFQFNVQRVGVLDLGCLQARGL